MQSAVVCVVSFCVDEGCMSSITAKEWELLSFFEVEPVLLDPDVPWCYNDAVYSVQFDGLSASFAVSPASRDVRLVAHRGEQQLRRLRDREVQR